MLGDKISYQKLSKNIAQNKTKGKTWYRNHLDKDSAKKGENFMYWYQSWKAEK